MMPVADVSGISYELQHRTPPGRWFFSRALGADPNEAFAELSRVRALAAGMDLPVKYRAVRQERAVLPW